jgi:hypothetical protein
MSISHSFTRKKFNNPIGRGGSNGLANFRNIHPNHFVNYLKSLNRIVNNILFICICFNYFYLFFIGSNSEAKEFLNRDGKIIIRMRGLPFDAVAKNVVSRQLRLCFYIYLCKLKRY